MVKKTDNNATFWHIIALVGFLYYWLYYGLASLDAANVMQQTYYSIQCAKGVMWVGMCELIVIATKK